MKGGRAGARSKRRPRVRGQHRPPSGAAAGGSNVPAGVREQQSGGKHGEQNWTGRAATEGLKKGSAGSKGEAA